MEKFLNKNIKPTSITICTDLVTKTIFENSYDFKKPNKESYKKSFKFSKYDDLVVNLIWNNQINERLTMIDKAVLNSVITLYLKGEVVQTIKQIYELTTFKKYTSQKQQRQMIKDAMYKLSKLDVCINIDDKKIKNPITKKTKSTSEISQHTLNNDGKCKINSFFGTALDWIGFDLTLDNGSNVTAYKILYIGLLWEYAAWAGQIKTFNKGYYELPINSTKANIAIRDYLLNLLHIKNNKIEIRPQKMFNKCQVDLNKNQSSYLYKTISKILNTWKTRKYIKEFKFVAKGHDKHYKLIITKQDTSEWKVKKWKKVKKNI